MSKQLRFTYKDKEYCLEFTRRSVETMERNGFIANDIREKPMTTLPALFAGAFLANHRFVSRLVRLLDFYIVAIILRTNQATLG